MTPKKSYSRFFIILQEDEKGYSLEQDKAPSGYAKLEMKNNKCKLSYYVQNVNKQKGPCHMILICDKKDTKKIIKIAKMNIDDYGRADVTYEYDMNNIANSGISADKIAGAAIVKLDGNRIGCIMHGFITSDVSKDWKDYEVVSEEDMKPMPREVIFDEYEQRIEAAKENNMEESNTAKNDIAKSAVVESDIEENIATAKNDMENFELDEEMRKKKNKSDCDCKEKDDHKKEEKKECKKEEKKKEEKMDKCKEHEHDKHDHKEKKEYCDEHKSKEEHHKEHEHCDDHKMEKDCEHMKEHHDHEMKKDCEHMKEHHDHEMKKDCEHMKEHHDHEMKKDCEHMKEHHDHEMKKDCEHMKEDHDHGMKKDCDYAEKEYEYMKEDCSHMKKDYDHMSKSHGYKMKKDCDYMEKEYEYMKENCDHKMKKEHEHMKKDCNYMKKDYEHMNKYYDHMKKDCGHMKKEYDHEMKKDYDYMNKYYDCMDKGHDHEMEKHYEHMGKGYDYKMKHECYPHHEEHEKMYEKKDTKSMMAKFFKDIAKEFEKMNGYNDIKNCEWYKVPVEKMEEMYCMHDYKKYTVIYYPMICYYPYIAKHKHFMIGHKYDINGNLKYIVYALPGKKSESDQPYGGKTGFVAWMPHRHDAEMGYWLMFYDFKNSTVVVPVKR